MNLEKMNKSELLEVAETQGLDVDDNMSKKDLIAILEKTSNVIEVETNVENAHADSIDTIPAEIVHDPVSKKKIELFTVKIRKSGRCYMGGNKFIDVKMGEVIKVNTEVKFFLKKRAFI